MIYDFVDNVSLSGGDEGDESHGLSAPWTAYGIFTPYFFNEPRPGCRWSFRILIFDREFPLRVVVASCSLSRLLPYTLFPHSVFEMVGICAEVPGCILVRFGHVGQETPDEVHRVHDDLPLFRAAGNPCLLPIV